MNDAVALHKQANERYKAVAAELVQLNAELHDMTLRKIELERRLRELELDVQRIDQMRLIEQYEDNSGLLEPREED